MNQQSSSTPAQVHDAQQWLSLKDASGFLGVHFTTLRNWADSGKIRYIRTPGGHRRFSLTELRRFLDARSSHAIVTSSDGLVNAAVGRARQEIAKIPQEQSRWHYQLDESETDMRRQRGRQLFSLAISYVMKPQQRDKLGEEGRKLGREYGREAAQGNVGLVETGRAVQFFRNQLLVAVRGEENSESLDADDMHIQQLINQFLDEVLYAVLDGYERSLIQNELR